MERDACAGTHPKWAKFPGASESVQVCSGGSLQACEWFASVRSGNKRARIFAQVRWKETHAQGRTQNGQTFLALQNRSKFVLEVRSKPASGLQALDREIKRPESLHRLGGKRRMRRDAPKMGKVSWRFTIGPNLFWRFVASLRVVCKR